MRAAVTVLALIMAVVAGFLLSGQYLTGISHTETGALGQLLDSAWFLWLVCFIGVAVLVVGAIAAMALRRH